MLNGSDHDSTWGELLRAILSKQFPDRFEVTEIVEQGGDKFVVAHGIDHSAGEVRNHPTEECAQNQCAATERQRKAAIPFASDLPKQVASPSP